MRRTALVLVLGVVLTLATVWAVAGQDDIIAGLVRPLVVDIDQAIPVVVTLAIPIDGGAPVTVTAPLTIGVQLRIAIDGQHLVSMEPMPAAATEAIAAPNVEVTELEPPAPHEGVALDTMLWTLTHAENVGPVYDDHTWPKIETTGTLIVVEFNVENVGKEPSERGQMVDQQDAILLQDAEGRQFEDVPDTYEERCFDLELNPGIPASCRIIFAVPENANGLEVLFGDQGTAALGF